MDKGDTRLIPGTKTEGRAKERAAQRDSGRVGDGETARENMSERQKA